MSSNLYDLVIVGDLRFPGGTSTCMAQEIRALANASYRLALVHIPTRRFNRNQQFHNHLQACIDEELCDLVDASETPLRAELLVLHNPYVFTEAPERRPQIYAATKILVAHQPIVDANGVPYYDAARVNAVCEDLFGTGIQWAPISAASRANLIAANLPYPILEEDWGNLIELDHWQADRSRPVGLIPVIGRHSRPEWEKWPATREDTLLVYPARDDIDVRLLGVAERLQSQIGEQPRNWRTYAFNELDPAQFLRSIDFFVYYHHQDWIEGFGRNIAEALASGCVVILPPHFQSVFQEAALYREPGDVVPTILEFYRDWERYQVQSDVGRRFITRLCGPDAHLKRVRRLISAAPVHPNETDGFASTLAAVKPSNPAKASIHEADVTVVGDFRCYGETAWRVAHEARIQAAAGYRTALVHLPGQRADVGPVIHPAIDACVGEGLATPLDPASTLIHTRLLIIHGPESVLSGDPQPVPRILADKIVVVVDQSPVNHPPPYDLIRKDRLFRTHFGGELYWAPVDEEIRHSIVEHNADVRLLDSTWTPSLALPTWRTRPRAHTVPIIGRSSLAGDRQWPDTAEEVEQVYPANGELVVRVACAPALRSVAGGPPPAAWQLFHPASTDQSKFIDNLDFFVYYAGNGHKELPSHAIIEAMARGVVTILPRHLKAQFGTGPLYTRPQRAIAMVHSLFARQDAYDDQATHAARQARQQFGANIHKARLRHLIGDAIKEPYTTHRRRANNRVLFVSSNGVGLGHLTRLLAVARRMPEPVEPVFATMSQALQIVEQHGFPAEHIPFHAYNGCNIADWNVWLSKQLRQVIDYYAASTVVFDGSVPYSGLIDAVGPDPDCRLAWIRRGMWRPEQANDGVIARQQHFDLIIEPDDIAATQDNGLTVENRHAALTVAPIRLLDEDELLSRQDAAEALGLDPDRPALLIQLGAGSNQDVVSVTGRILQTAAAFPQLQPVIAEWLMAPHHLDLWPGVKRLRGYPLSRYFKAFDFAVGAAGYNAFNEAISLALPTIFVPNDQPEMDDQRARATHAEANGAALCLDDPQTTDLSQYFEIMLNQDVRNHLKTNCARLTRANGAAAAAGAIADYLM